MFKTLASACLLVLGLAADPARAVGDLGFETGSTQGWSVSADGALLSAESRRTLTLVDEADSSFTSTATLTPAAGSYFGLLQMGAMPATDQLWPSSYSSQASFSLDPSLSTGGTLYLRLLTSDYWYSTPATPGGPAYDDQITVRYDGDASSAQGLSASFILGAGAVGDSGWQAFALRPGTQQVQVTLTNYYNVEASNAPLAAIDFSATAVPEPSSFALMALGLGVLLRVRSRSRA